MGNYDWSMGFLFGGLTVEFRWEEHFYDGHSMGYFGSLAEAAIPGRRVADDDAEQNLPRWLSSALKTAACAVRRAEIQTEWNPSTLIIQGELLEQKILELFERAQRGEFLGQVSANGLLYVQDVAALLDSPFSHVRSVVDGLVADHRLGLNGMILIPAKDYEAAFTYWERATGHRRLTMGDWGNWYCAACGRSGDEQDDPRAVECSRIQPGNA